MLKSMWWHTCIEYCSVHPQQQMKKKIYLFRIGMATFYTCLETSILQLLKLCSLHICRVVFFNYPFLIFLLGFDSWIGWIRGIWIAELMRQIQKSVIWYTQQLQVCSVYFYHKKCVSFSAELTLQNVELWWFRFFKS